MKHLSLKVKIPPTSGERNSGWLSPAAMYSVVPAGTKVSEFALGQREGCDLSHGICLSRARLSASACHKVVTGVQVVALSIGPLCRHDITRSDRQIGNVSVTYVTLVP